VFQNIGPLELLIILAAALLIFGPSRLPELGRSLGRTLREFRQAAREPVEELKRTLVEEKEPSEEQKRPLSREEEGKAG